MSEDFIKRANAVIAHHDWSLAKDLLEEAVEIVRMLQTRIGDILLKDRGKTTEINILVKENRELCERLEQTEAGNLLLQDQVNRLRLQIPKCLHAGCPHPPEMMALCKEHRYALPPE